MDKLKVIIVEDEPLAQLKLKSFIEKVDCLDLISIFSTGEDAIDFLKLNEIDLMFLDIRMDGLSGIQVLKALINSPLIVITTAYEEYAIKSYEFNVIDYLLKPYSFERFIKSICKIKKHLNMFNNESYDDNNYVLIKSDYRTEKIFFNDILFIEGMGDYLRVYTKTRKIMTLRNF